MNFASQGFFWSGSQADMDMQLDNLILEGIIRIAVQRISVPEMCTSMAKQPFQQNEHPAGRWGV
jgi:hypothetical protein